MTDSARGMALVIWLKVVAWTWVLDPSARQSLTLGQATKARLIATRDCVISVVVRDTSTVKGAEVSNMVYCAIADGGRWIVTIVGTQEIFGIFDNPRDAEELAAYLNGGDVVPSYMEKGAGI
jgi:hypothetical protein